MIYPLIHSPKGCNGCSWPKLKLGLEYPSGFLKWVGRGEAQGPGPFAAAFPGPCAGNWIKGGGV